MAPRDDNTRRRRSSTSVEVPVPDASVALDAAFVDEVDGSFDSQWARKLRGDVSALKHAEAERAKRERTIARTAKWALGLALTALPAGVGAIYVAGVRSGLSTAAAERMREDRARLDRCDADNHRQDMDISNLRGLIRARRADGPGDEP